MRLDYRHRLLHALAASEESALTPDDLRHDRLLIVRERDLTAVGLHGSAILLAETLADNPSTRIQLCGRLAVELAGSELTPKLPGGQARVLFTYLTVSRALPSRREELIEALWPWRAPAGADTALSALSRGCGRCSAARCCAVAARSTSSSRTTRGSTWKPPRRRSIAPRPPPPRAR